MYIFITTNTANMLPNLVSKHSGDFSMVMRFWHD